MIAKSTLSYKHPSLNSVLFMIKKKTPQRFVAAKKLMSLVRAWEPTQWSIPDLENIKRGEIDCFTFCNSCNWRHTKKHIPGKANMEGLEIQNPNILLLSYMAWSCTINTQFYAFAKFKVFMWFILDEFFFIIIIQHRRKMGGG